MSKPIEKIIYESQLKCPWCSKLIRAKVTRMTITPSVKGETVTEGIFEKDTQITLDEVSKKVKPKSKDHSFVPGDNLDDDFQESIKPAKKQVIRKGF